jgi:hypothetical protein
LALLSQKEVSLKCRDLGQRAHHARQSLFSY